MTKPGLMFFAAALLSCLGCLENSAPTLKPNEVVQTNFKAAQTALEAGNEERAIDLLATCLAADKATNRGEARALLEQTIVAKYKRTAHQELVNFDPQHPGQKLQYVLPHAEWNAEQLVQEYLLAPSWLHRLPFVAKQEQARLLIQEYLAYQPQKQFDILPVDREPRDLGESTVVEVVRSDGKQVPYVVVKQPSGVRVDWEESQRSLAAREDADFRKAYELQNALLEVCIPRKEQWSDRGVFSIYIMNESEVTIADLELDVEIYADNGKHLSTVTIKEKDLSRRNDALRDVSTGIMDPAFFLKTQVRFQLKSLRMQLPDGEKMDVLRHFQFRETTKYPGHGK